MKLTETKFNRSSRDQSLSNLVVSRTGKLKYREPALVRILQVAAKITPFMAWYVFIGMLVVLSMSVWGIAHPEVAVTHLGEVTAYLFLIVFSTTAAVAMIAAAFFFARKRIIEREDY